mmetsp:Transcript_8152/g.24425  ORF Transcript_8152/g.24425 Transcript_8152/m.24425 type:complete len:247 (-) Transcript_8152:728-1468(-)
MAMEESLCRSSATAVLRGFRLEGTVRELGHKLLWNRVLLEVVTLGNHHIQLGGLGGHDLGLQAIGAEVDLAPVRLVNGHARELAEGLELDSFAVHRFHRGDDVLEDHSDLFARVHDDRVHLALDLHDAVLVSVDHHSLVRLGFLDHDLLVLDVTLHKPLSSRELCLSDFGALGSRLLLRRRLHQAGPVRPVLGLHVRSHLLQASGHAVSLVQLREECGGASGGLCGGLGLGQRPGRRRWRRGWRAT